MFHFRNDLPGYGVFSGITQHDKSDKFLSEICSDHLFANKISRKLLLDCFEILSEVPKCAPLPGRAFVEDFRHPADKLVIIISFTYFHSILLRLSDEASSSP